MIYYIFPYVFLLITSFFFYNSNQKCSLSVLFFCLFPACLIVILRGNVGTDTDTYLRFYRELIRNADYDPSFEKGFTFLSKFTVNLGANEGQSVATIGLLTTILLCVCFSENYDKFLIFTLLIFPTFFYDMTMNGLRYGLSFALIAIAVQNLYKRRKFIFIVISLMAFSIQSSSLFIFLIFFIGELPIKVIIISLILIVITIYLTTFSIIDLDYFYGKQDMYKDFYSPDISSGLSPLIIFLLIYFTFLFFCKNELNRLNKVIHIILLLEILAFILAKFSYAGLRFQMVFLFSLILFISNNFNLLKDKTKIMYYFGLIGIISFLITIKHFNYNDDEVASPFLPYKFYWDELN